MEHDICCEDIAEGGTHAGYQVSSVLKSSSSNNINFVFEDFMYVRRYC